MKSKSKKAGLISSIIIFYAISLFAQPIDYSKLTGKYLGQKEPGLTPEIFAPNIITTELTEHGTVTFSPDGKEVFWSVIYSDPFRKKIMTMKQEDKGWTVPQIASFSLGENEGNPIFSPDGKRVFFTGWRSAEGYAGSKHLIMYAEKTEEGWSEPGLLDPIINSISRYWHISVARNGNFYFYSDKDGGGIFYSKYMNKDYTSPEKLNLSFEGGTPFIAPDDSYIIFSAKQDEGFGEIDLYISFRKKGNTWTIGKNLGPLINSDQDDIWPIVSPDGKFLFFTSARTGNMDIFWVSAKIIDELKPKDLK
ncbi:MAG: hypothetical protein KKG99_12985 [Bacteroidetes bacterium]|nr:hypothetical protein [Bacteroidota bacterium]